MRPPKYLGVYSQPLAKADGTRKTLFFAWDLAEQGYAVQQLDNAFQPKAEARRVSAAHFAAQFRSEPSILAMPMTMLDVRALADLPDARARRARSGCGCAGTGRRAAAAFGHGAPDQTRWKSLCGRVSARLCCA